MCNFTHLQETETSFVITYEMEWKHYITDIVNYTIIYEHSEARNFTSLFTAAD